ncbi:CBS domain-containing protein [Streptomyces sp. AS58]|uniref:CBS domain-containing protein n=1 Tax=Streptomyces sp. AS58 TaxID=1519489 RepID=UPI0006AE3A08|nr:CBS domain-containing protein [Streptomyces sp. AS58]
MNEHENFSTEAEARRDVPSRPSSPGETARQDTLLRYLGAVATAASKHAGTEAQAPTALPSSTASPAPPSAALTPQSVSAPESGLPLVRDVMDVPAASLREDLPYRDIARSLAREHAGALPVVDAEDHVLGVVSESDLLAKVAFEASGHRPGPIGRLRERRIHGKARGDLAADLMTSPAITVLPGATVAEAAWLAALSRLKRMPVTDRDGRLVGVVRRDALLQSLIRDDAGIRTEVEAAIAGCCPPGDREDVEVAVHDGIVELTGRMPSATLARLVAEVEEISDVVEVKNLLTAA